MSSKAALIPAASRPSARTSLVGRAAELAAARVSLVDEAVPLLTLTGPGGVGKTRLALAVAQEVAGAFADGAVFVDLSAVLDWGLVLPTIAQAVGVREAGDRPLAAVLAASLRPRQLLIVLDNCEHVLEAAPAAAALLAACPALQILATSRAPLRVRAECLLPVPPLALADPEEALPLDVLSRTEAIALFAQRAHAADPGFALTEQNVAAVAEICRRVDGLPLAIELAAARLRALSPSALQALLTDRLRLLTGGPRDVSARQRTMRATIAWSHDLLSSDQQALFRRLAAFTGSFDLEALTAVVGGDPVVLVDGLEQLIEQSLVQRTVGPGGVRFGMLETVREFAQERLRDQGESDATGRAHAAYFLDLAEQAEAEIYGPAMRMWLDRLEVDWPNLRAALAFFADTGDAIGALRLATKMSEYWSYRGYVPEGVASLARAVGQVRDAPSGVVARGLTELAFLAHLAGDHQRALDASAASLQPARDDGDTYRLVQTLYVRSLAVGHGVARWDEAIALLEEARMLAETLEDPVKVQAFILSQLGSVMVHVGERERGAALLEEVLPLQLASGRQMEAGLVLAELGRLDREAGDGARAARRCAESLRLLREGSSVAHVGTTIGQVAALAADRGRADSAARSLGMIRAIEERTGWEFAMKPALDRDQIERKARATLGEKRFAAAFAAGRALRFADAIDEALAVASELAANPADGVAPGVSSARSSADASRSTPLDTPSYGLSRREREVLALLAQRWSDKEIAEALVISPRTVMTHATHIFAKLDVANRREAAALAVRHGLI